jgi:hypothetical protein
MNTLVKIPFGNCNGVVVHISQVKNGLDCNCKCCKCEARLIAKNHEENIREAHFAHYNAPDCDKALEKSIHEAAKQFLFQNKKIVVPDILDYGNSNELSFEKVNLEERLPYNIQVDALGYKNDSDKFIIEIAVTHFVDSLKKQKINKLKIPAVEVTFDRTCITFDDIEKVLLGSGFKKWLYHPIQDTDINSYIEKYNTKIDNLTNTIQSLQINNLELIKEKDELEKLNENLRIENVKIDMIQTLQTNNHKLINEKNELEKMNEKLRLENVKLERNLKGFKA